MKEKNAQSWRPDGGLRGQEVALEQRSVGEETTTYSANPKPAMWDVGAVVGEGAWKVWLVAGIKEAATRTRRR